MASRKGKKRVSMEDKKRKGRREIKGEWMNS